MNNSIYSFANWLISKNLTLTGQEHIPNTGPIIFVSNHEGFLDAPVLSTVIHQQTGKQPFFPTTPWVWKFFKKFGGNWILNWIGMIPISSSQPSQSLNVAENFLGQGGVIGIFPEGRRNGHNQHLIKGKTGAVRLALSTNTKIIPIGIKAHVGNQWSAIIHAFTRKPNTVKFGQPIDLSAWSNQPINKPLLYELTTKVMNEVGKLCHKPYLPENS